MTEMKNSNHRVANDVQSTVERVPHRETPVVQDPIPPAHGQHVIHGARGLMQLFGLHGAAAALAVIVDIMVFGGDIVSVGTLIPLGIGAAVVLGIIVYRIQRSWYFDTHDTALTKALIIGLLTAIPVPLTPIIVIPCGLLGFIQTLSRGKQS